MNTLVIKLNEEPSNKRRNGATEDKRTKNTIESQIQLDMVHSPSGSNIVLDKTRRNVDHTIIFMTQGSMDMEVSLIKFHLVRFQPTASQPSTTFRRTANAASCHSPLSKSARTT